MVAITIDSNIHCKEYQAHNKVMSVFLSLDYQKDKTTYNIVL